MLTKRVCFVLFMFSWVEKNYIASL